MQRAQGAVATGHPDTSKAAAQILADGGNAFDAVVAAQLAACVVEPVFTSLAGGGYLLAQSAQGKNTLYDFFVQTPQRKHPAQETDFYPICADFGTAQQEFHIGRGSIATPGIVKGLFAIHEELCSLPMQRLAEPAITLARNGILISDFQAYLFEVVDSIYLSHADTQNRYSHGEGEKRRLLKSGELMRQPELANTLDALSREGAALFYQGEIAQAIAKLCSEQGGHLARNDFANYRVVQRNPLTVTYRNASLLTNPPPSSGGTLIAFALKLLDKFDVNQHRYGSAATLDLLARVLEMTNKARIDASLDGTIPISDTLLLDPHHLANYRQQIKGHAICSRGTTHISVIDKLGNIASLTSSNGEGCGLFIPDTGIMLNNMLGEEDLNPNGFHQWPLNQRMTSMMSPSILLLPDKRRISLGSGGSNRLRTAILQVLLNLIDFDMSLQQAVTSPRIHFETDLLSIEGGFESAELECLLPSYPQHKVWPQANFFFGGVHSVCIDGIGFSGIGDPRRCGHASIVR